MKNVKIIISAIFFIAGFLIIVCSMAVITGAFIGFNLDYNYAQLFGILFVIISFIVFIHKKELLEHKISVTSNIKDSGLIKYAERATQDEHVQEDINHLIQELFKGNLQAGIGTKHLTDTNIFYMRAKSGARLFYRKIGENAYQIVGKSDKKVEDSVIGRLIKLYRK